jgi:hypothetical protein
MKKGWQALTMTVAICLAGSGSLRAQEKDIVIDGQVKAGVHKFKLDNSSLYQLEVKGKKFVPNVTMLGYFIPNTADFVKEQNTFRGLVAPPKTGEYTLIVLPNIGFNPPGDLLDYTVTLKTMQLDETPLLKKEDKLTSDDPKYANKQAFRMTTHFKAYPVKVKAKQTVIIDMIAKKADGNKIDPYLYLESPTKIILARDDDGGGYPNARIMFHVPADGEYNIIASALNDQTIGEFTVMVRTVKGEK